MVPLWDGTVQEKCQRLASAVGLYHAIWRPSLEWMLNGEHRGRRAAALIGPVYLGNEALLARASCHYMGDIGYVKLTEFVASYLDALVTYPDALVCRRRRR